MLSSQSRESLLLGMRVDIGTNHERNQVEEWNPSLLWQESLSESQTDWGGNPADAHDGPETGSDGGSDLVEGSGAGNDCHGDEIDRVLDW
jgi:hypothetical protein